MVVFQPHRFTRTRDLFDEFCNVLSRFDAVLMLEVYPAGETAIAGADSSALCRAIRKRGQVEPILADSQAHVEALLPAVVEDGDIILVLGAGDIGSLGQRLVDSFAA